MIEDYIFEDDIFNEEERIVILKPEEPNLPVEEEEYIPPHSWVDEVLKEEV